MIASHEMAWRSHVAQFVEGLGRGLQFTADTVSFQLMMEELTRLEALEADLTPEWCVANSGVDSLEALTFTTREAAVAELAEYVPEQVPDAQVMRRGITSWQNA